MLPAEILATGTQLRAMPLVPEIRLHLADEPFGLWQHIERLSGRDGTDPPFWAFAWAGGQALARYLLDHPETVRGRTVLDVASGSGLVAIAAALAGAQEVTACDIDPLAAAAIEVNAAANGAEVRVVCEDIFGSAVPAASLVVAADAFYERDLAEQVTGFLDRAAAGGATVLAGDFGRTYLPRKRLAPLARYDVSGLFALEGVDVKSTTVWTWS